MSINCCFIRDEISFAKIGLVFFFLLWMLYFLWPVEVMLCIVMVIPQQIVVVVVVASLK